MKVLEGYEDEFLKYIAKALKNYSQIKLQDLKKTSESGSKIVSLQRNN
jgi:hypothetical protein